MRCCYCGCGCLRLRLRLLRRRRRRRLLLLPPLLLLLLLTVLLLPLLTVLLPPLLLLMCTECVVCVMSGDGWCHAGRRYLVARALKLPLFCLVTATAGSLAVGLRALRSPAFCRWACNDREAQAPAAGTGRLRRCHGRGHWHTMTLSSCHGVSHLEAGLRLQL